jgi:hypothetical protein
MNIYKTKYLKIFLFIWGLLYILPSFAQYNIIHRIREDVNSEKEVQVAKEEWKEWTDISYMTPNFLSCKVQTLDNTLSFKVEDEDYVYAFTEDDPEKSKQLEWNIRNQTQNKNGQTFINDYLTKIVPTLGMEYVTIIKNDNNAEKKKPSDPLSNLEIIASPVQDSQFFESKSNVIIPKETNNNNKEGNARDVLKIIITAFIIMWLFKGVLKAIFSTDKKEKNDSWLDEAWFHDHNQKI